MKRLIKIIALIILLVLLVLTAIFLFYPIEQATPIRGETSNSSDYCEVAEINGTYSCLPEDKCQMLDLEDGKKLCIARR